MINYCKLDYNKLLSIAVHNIMLQDYEIVHTDFENFSDIIVSDLNKATTQLIAFISRNGKPFVVKTDNIKITSNGIPQLDKEDNCHGYYPDDGHREFINIGLDLNQSACVHLKTFFNKADNFFGSEQMRKILFGTKASRYVYLPLVKTKETYADDDDDDYHKNKRLPYPDYIKIKFITVPLKNTGRKIWTNLKKNGLQVKAETVTEIASHVKFNSTASFTIHFRKIWADKHQPPNDNKYHYGVGLAMIEIEMGKFDFIYMDKPIYDKAGLRKAYKKYLDEKKNSICKHVAIEI
jgi:hypothetical protein